MNRPSVNIAYIGGGSREWAVKLIADLALSSAISGELRLYDIDAAAAQHNEALGKEIFQHPEAKSFFAVRAVQELTDALKGADFVVISIEPGPVALREADLDIPARYGILQTVGDTTGPGGILRAMRTVPIYRPLVRSIMDICPEAWVINYTNPMSICTAALHALASGIKAFGCCHEVFGTQKMLAEFIARKFETEAPARQEIRLDISGVNHFTFATRARWRDHDLMPMLKQEIAGEEFFFDRSEISQQAQSEGRWFESQHLVAFDLLRRFGALGAAGDRHLVEFVPWYLTSEQELHRWGVLATPFSWRLKRSRSDRPRIENITKSGLVPSGEEGVDQIEALMGLRTLMTNVNLPNRGQIPWLPHGTIVETYAHWEKEMIRPLLTEEPPVGIRNLIARHADAQNALLQAALSGDTDLAFQVLLEDPLVRLPSEKAWEMFSSMLEFVGMKA